MSSATNKFACKGQLGQLLIYVFQTTTTTTANQTVQQQIIIQPPPPKTVKNKSLLCKPYVQTKATSCKPHTQTKEVQTGLLILFIGPFKHIFERKIVNFSLNTSLNMCLGAQKTRLNETVLFHTHNICFEKQK